MLSYTHQPNLKGKNMNVANLIDLNKNHDLHESESPLIY